MRTEPALDDAPDAKELSKVNGAIDVDHVSFAYEGELDVLHDVSLHVNPGETIAVVGPSGGGKSTLCQLIPRFYDVTGGSIRVDGQDVRAVTQQSLRRAIGASSSRTSSSSPIPSSRTPLRPPGRKHGRDRRRGEARRNLRRHHGDADGFDTYVGERGTLLSGGQKQRISIARVFLKDPSILILDEATSALDSMTEAKIQHAFDELAKNRTTLIIAHRLSTIRAASRIVVIVDGKIAEQGTHAELTALNGTYAALCRTQNLLQ